MQYAYKTCVLYTSFPYCFTSVFETKLEKDYLGLIQRSIGIKQTLKTNKEYNICTTCKSHLLKGKMPPMSNQNSLQLMDLTSYEELHLTELENSMIALNIIFQKVFNCSGILKLTFIFFSFNCPF